MRRQSDLAFSVSLVLQHLLLFLSARIISVETSKWKETDLASISRNKSFQREGIYPRVYWPSKRSILRKSRVSSERDDHFINRKMKHKEMLCGVVHEALKRPYYSKLLFSAKRRGTFRLGQYVTSYHNTKV